jgi:hypothetical protein
MVSDFLVAGVIAMADSGGFRRFFTWLNRTPFADKAGHFAGIGALAFFLNSALGGRALALGPVRLLLGGVIVALVMTGEEFSQVWIPCRRFEWGDLAANYAGIVVAQLVCRKPAIPRPEPSKNAA